MRVRPILDLSNSRTILFANHAQMRIFECIRVFQAITEDSVETGMSEQECPCELKRGDCKEVSQNVKHHCKPFVVNEVIGPGTKAWIPQIGDHAQIGSQKQKRIPCPRVTQSRK